MYFSVWLAFYLRSGTFTSLQGPTIWPAVASVALALPVFITSGLYRAIFRNSGLPAMVAVGRAMLLNGLTFAAIFTFWGVDGVPRTVGLIQPILLLLLVGASRAAARVWLGGLYHQQLRKVSLPQALIYGAGSAGRQLASAMANSPEIRVVGFLDDDDRLHGHGFERCTRLRALLKDLVSGYQPSGEVVDWDHMALEREALANK